MCCVWKATFFARVGTLSLDIVFYRTRRKRRGVYETRGGPACRRAAGYRDGLRHHGPPLHRAHKAPRIAVSRVEGAELVRRPLQLRPATELLRALSRCSLPHVKLSGCAVSLQSVRTALGEISRIGATQAHLVAVRCPRQALSSPAGPGARARATTYLPHVHELLALRHFSAASEKTTVYFFRAKS